jgi:hypothetical protein
VCGSLFFGTLIADVVLRQSRTARYVLADGFHHRPENIQQSGIFQDKPRAIHSYPRWPRGYEDVDYVLSTDHRGFRNEKDITQCEVLVIGDSFVDGSGVSDEHRWPVLLSQRSRKHVYSLGIPGGSPGSYLAALAGVGRSLKPEVVLCTIYEGNDFRGDGTVSYRKDAKHRDLPNPRPIKNSPVRIEGKKFLNKALAIDSRNRTLRRHQTWQTFPFSSSRLNAVNWLPVSISTPAPKRNRDRYIIWVYNMLTNDHAVPNLVRLLQRLDRWVQLALNGLDVPVGRPIRARLRNQGWRGDRSLFLCPAYRPVGEIPLHRGRGVRQVPGQNRQRT